ncbi:hypothetical protein KO489_05725 [Reinekea forsetii]|nr:hypothetical protein [Reinekea forsetii]
MKYFTSDWWASGCTDESVFERYSEYFQSISKLLPAGILELQNSHTLHDANVKNIECDFIENTVSIRFLGWDTNFENQLIYDLIFSSVTDFKQCLPQEEEVDVELGDLGYYEYEVIGEVIQMRMLFATKAEFVLNFKGFEFSVQESKA